YLYMLAFYDRKKGPATALSVIGFLVLCLCAGTYMILSLRKEDD
ncbi:MAG: sugar ABC transporter permease, partial [Clostridia bacterium]|nr:sugar ABC transporter permease [Clostridia bacterium]